MTWLERQNFLGVDSDAMLARTRVAIIGLGGGGSHVVQQLAHIGIGHFVIVDDDEISNTNLNRLVGGTRLDVDQAILKVEIARRLILSVNPNAVVEVHNAKWQETAFELRDCDIVFGCVDNVRAKAELDSFCRRMQIPFIDQGMDVHKTADGFLISGQVVLSMSGGPCLRCFGVVTDQALDDEARNYGAAGGKPQVVWPNGVLASSAVGLLVQLITPWHSGPIGALCLEYDGNRQTVQPSDRIPVLTRYACPHHDERDLGDPRFDIRGVVDSPSAESADEPDRASLFVRMGRLIRNWIGP